MKWAGNRSLPVPSRRYPFINEQHLANSPSYDEIEMGLLAVLLATAMGSAMGVHSEVAESRRFHSF